MFPSKKSFSKMILVVMLYTIFLQASADNGDYETEYDSASDNEADNTANTNANTLEEDDKNISENDGTNVTESYDTNISDNNDDSNNETGNDDSNTSEDDGTSGNDDTDLSENDGTNKTEGDLKNTSKNNNGSKNNSGNKSSYVSANVKKNEKALTEVEAYKPSLNEQVHGSIAHLAALIDREHKTFTHKLNADEVILTEDEINVMFKDKMFEIVATVLPGLKHLAKVTEDPVDSANQVNKHFAPDHIILEIAAVVDPDEKPPFADSLAEDISEFASALVRLILRSYNKKKS